MPTFGEVTDLSEQQQAAIDSAQVGYEAFLQSLNPFERAEVEARDRAELEAQAGELEAKSQEQKTEQASITQAAKDEAVRLDVDLLEVEGSGEGGRILVEDVRNHAGLGAQGNGGND